MKDSKPLQTLKKYFINFVSALFFVNLFSGCSKQQYGDVGLYEYSMRQKESVAIRLHDNKIKTGSVKLEKGKKVKIELAESSKVLSDKTLSYFHSFQFEGKEGQRYLLKIESIGSGDIYNTYAVIPKVHIFDNNYQAVDVVQTKMLGRITGFAGHFVIENIFEFDLVQEGNYYLVVTSENSHIGRTLKQSSNLYYAELPANQLHLRTIGHYMGQLQMTLNESVTH